MSKTNPGQLNIGGLQRRLFLVPECGQQEGEIQITREIALSQLFVFWPLTDLVKRVDSSSENHDYSDVP
ncbi:hypothetical protein [Pseudovibrio sp. Ad13]|uniref:hypothetical protein n=1 Tax=Pseudovibrio sp. Ad13 TaxID=989396 RepID=UPI00187D0FDC|nr:hypothetical protein [Pseudovibrio sp. Ad13]